MIIRLILTLSIFSSIGNINPPDETTLHQETQRVSIERALAAIRNIPEGAQLLEDIKSEGDFTVELRTIDSFDFGALWDAASRTVVVNARRCHNQGTLISSLLFELHNARTTKFLITEANKVIDGKRRKDDYVRNVEQMEHENALATIQILEEGIERGIFPKTARWTIISSFDDHYKLQQVTGHSLWIADNYDLMSPLSLQTYQGTIEGLASLTETDKKEISYYLSIKNNLQSASETENEVAYRHMNSILNQMVNCELYPFLDEDRRHKERKRNLQLVFEGHPLYEETSKKLQLIYLSMCSEGQFF